MTTAEIEQASKEYGKLCSENDDCEISFLRGAEMVNSRQPYTAEDMQETYRFGFLKGIEQSSVSILNRFEEQRNG